MGKVQKPNNPEYNVCICTVVAVGGSNIQYFHDKFTPF
jgi:hypothetical protein